MPAPVLPKVSLVVCLVLTVMSSCQAAAAPDYEKDVLPILRQHCYSCHDGRKQTATLRLDLRARALKGGESGDVGIVPGKPEASSLIQRIASTDPDVRMPPEGNGLNAKEIQTLKEWVQSGAPWPDSLAGDENAALKHWAFQPPVRPDVPADPTGWSKNAIDNFVQVRLKQEGLKPSPEADKATLLRRLSLDLIGLPPTIEELDAFLADDRPDAYSRQVERLLASPHYGERWGRIWLDAARYADSDGFEKDKPRFVWFYRDWVVNALNRDLPYDQFVIEQLAGDLLPSATQDQIVATGFLRNSMINEEGGIDPEQFRMEAMFDRMDAIGKSVLGLTIQCAQCHDHKYDPITQADYYRLFAFLNNSTEGSTAVYTPPQLEKRAEILRKAGEIEANLKHMTADWQERVAEWETSLAPEPKWTVARPELDASGAQKHYLLEDGSILGQGYAPTKWTSDFAATIAEVPEINAVRLELLNDPNLPLGGPGRAVTGLCALTEFSVDVLSPEPGAKPVKVRFAKVLADANPAEAELDPMFGDKTNKRRVTGPAAYAIDGEQLTAWGIDVGAGRSNVPRTAVFVPEKPIANTPGTKITFRLTQNHGGWNSDDNQNNNLGRFRLSVTGDAISGDSILPTSVVTVLRTPAANRSPAQVDVLFSHWRTTVPEFKPQNEEIEALWKSHPQPSSQLVLRERGEARVTHMLKRGDFLKPADAVRPGVPAFLASKGDDSGSDRMALARWMVDRKHPTTARSIVNRIWQSDFGIGLVSTSEDFGLQADAPSHPELLDWLAVELMEPSVGGNAAAPWSLKNLHRLIVQSATYRQSSKVSSDLGARDPYNRLLARGARFRVDAELVRDIALAASGLLNRETGGRPVHPPLPDFMLQPPVSYGPKTWKEDTDAQRYRRALYTFRFRSIPYPVLQAFDAPNGDFSCVRRARSNTPLQALMTLNEPIFMECARGMALTMLKSEGDEEHRINVAFRRCASRPPTPQERTVLLDLLQAEKQRFAGDEAAAWQAAANDPAQPPELPAGAKAADAAAWTAVSRVLLNLDETITRE
jgi:hypothetical protein